MVSTPSPVALNFINDYSPAMNIVDLTFGSASWGEASLASERVTMYRVVAHKSSHKDVLLKIFDNVVIKQQATGGSRLHLQNGEE